MFNFIKNLFGAVNSATELLNELARSAELASEKMLEEVREKNRLSEIESLKIKEVNLIKIIGNKSNINSSSE